MAALYGYGLDTPVAVPDARSGPCTRGHLQLQITDRDLLDRQGELVVLADQEYTDDTFAVFRVRDGLLVWCSVTGSFLVDPAAGTVTVAPRGDSEFWQHRLSATVIPLLLAERGDLVLHAAAVLNGPGAVAFCGTTGRGKSTLAAALALAGRAVAAEDGTVISELAGRPVVWPGPHGVRVTAAVWARLGGRLAPRAPKYKAMRLAGTDPQEISEPRPLAAVVILGERGPGSVELRRLDPPDALRALIPNALFAGPDALAETLQRTARLVERVAVFEVRFPDDLDQLAAAASQTIEAVSRVVPSQT